MYLISLTTDRVRKENDQVWRSVEPVEGAVKSSFVQRDGESGHGSNAVLVVDVGSSDGGLVVTGGGVQVAVAVFTGMGGGGAGTQRVGGPDVGDVDDRLVHENDGDEDGEALLREASDVADQSAQVERDRHQQEQRDPDADPQTERQKIDVVLST